MEKKYTAIEEELKGITIVDQDMVPYTGIIAEMLETCDTDLQTAVALTRKKLKEIEEEEENK